MIYGDHKQTGDVRELSREMLHGHNYRLSIEVGGNMVIGKPYLLDFGKLKKIVKEECDILNEKVLLPGKSQEVIMTEFISESGTKQVKLILKTKQKE